MKKFNSRRAFGGGGKCEEARVACLFDDLAAKQLGSGATHVALCDNIGSYFIHLCKVLAAKFLEVDKSISRWDDKSETEKERKPIVGRIYQSDNETIQSFSSPAFVPLAEAREQLLPTPRWGEGGVTDAIHESSCNSHHYEPQQLLSIVIPSDS